MRTQIRFGKPSTSTPKKFVQTQLVSRQNKRGLYNSENLTMLKSTRLFLHPQNKIQPKTRTNAKQSPSPGKLRGLILPSISQSTSIYPNSTKQAFAPKTFKNNSSRSNKQSIDPERLSNDYYIAYPPSKHADISHNLLSAYGVNTYQGMIRNYNEDRITVIIDAKSPFDGIHWPHVSYFGIYDGHAGNRCAEYLKCNLHNTIFRSNYFPDEPIKAIEDGFKQTEQRFTSSIYQNRTYQDFSGSCALVIIIIDNMCYVANLGDSRAIYSKNSGEELFQITRDQKPNDPIEHKRIREGGGSIYQTPGFGLGACLPYRILPGKLSVARAIGDVEAKLPLYGGNPRVLIAVPTVYSFTIEDDSDFIVSGCDGIYDKLSNEEIFEMIWKFKTANKTFQDMSDLSGKITDAVIKYSMKKYTSDNVTCIFICFENFKRKMNEIGFEKKIGFKNVKQMGGEIDLIGPKSNGTGNNIGNFKVVPKKVKLLYPIS